MLFDEQHERVFSIMLNAGVATALSSVTDGKKSQCICIMTATRHVHYLVKSPASTYSTIV